MRTACHWLFCYCFYRCKNQEGSRREEGGGFPVMIQAMLDSILQRMFGGFYALLEAVLALVASFAAEHYAT